MDEIKIYGLNIYAHHGVYKEEKMLGQPFVINCTLYLNTEKAGLYDDTAQTVNYADVCHFIKKFIEENDFDLIERVAEETARAVLYKYSLVRAVSLEVEKPNAPIGLPLKTVSVKIFRKWHSVFISLGSNMGNRSENLENAVHRISTDKNIRLLKQSAIIETEPYGGVEQDKYLNGVIEIETLLGANELLEYLNEIEKDAKRTREVHWGPRTLDLDILFYDDEIIYTNTLIVPHVDMQNRSFVLEPMAEIAPYKLHPVFRKSMLTMLSDLKNKNL